MPVIFTPPAVSGDANSGVGLVWNAKHVLSHAKLRKEKGAHECLVYLDKFWSPPRMFVCF